MRLFRAITFWAITFAIMVAAASATQAGSPTSAPYCVVRGRVPYRDCAGCIRVDCGDNRVGKLPAEFEAKSVTLGLILSPAQTSPSSAPSSRTNPGPALKRATIKFVPTGKLAFRDLIEVADIDELARRVPPGAAASLRRYSGAQLRGIELGFEPAAPVEKSLFQDYLGRVPWNSKVVGATRDGWRCEWGDMESPSVFTAAGLENGRACIGSAECRRVRGSTVEFKQGSIVCGAIDLGTCPSANHCLDTGYLAEDTL